MITPADNTISIIVPVYNASATLDRCVGSVAGQSFSNWQLVLVDDGSTDGSGALCDAWAARDSRIKAVHKPNGGVSSARNAGLGEIRGGYVTFIDSDDYVDGEYLSTLIAGAGTDLCVCSYVEDKDGTTVPGEQIGEGLYAAGKLGRMYAAKLQTIQFLAPWAKLFRADIIRREQLRFDERFDSVEDTIFVLQYLAHVESVQVSDRPLYHYWQGGGGLSTSCTARAERYSLKGRLIYAAVDSLGARWGFHTDAVCAKITNGVFFSRLNIISQGVRANGMGATVRLLEEYMSHREVQRYLAVAMGWHYGRLRVITLRLLSWRQYRAVALLARLLRRI